MNQLERMKSELRLLLVNDNTRPYSTSTREERGKFSRSLVECLVEELESEPLEHLTPNEHAHLSVLVQTRLEVRHFSPEYQVPFLCTIDRRTKKITRLKWSSVSNIHEILLHPEC